jgi:CBS domain-containing protein
MKCSHRLLYLIMLIIGASSAFAVSLQGQVLLKDAPFEHLEVTAHWVDDNDVSYQKVTHTLDREEANYMGSSRLRGFYFFRDINAKEGTNIVISFKGFPYSLVVPYSRSDIKVTTISFSHGPGGAGQAYVEIEEEEVIDELIYYEPESAQRTFVQGNLSENVSIPVEFKEINVSEETVPVSIIEAESRLMQDAFIIILFALLLGGIILVAVLFIRFGSDYVITTVTDIARPPNPERIMSRKIRNIARSSVEVSADESCRNALSQMIRMDIDLLAAFKDDKFLGIIPEKSFLVKGYASDKKISEEGMIVPEEGVGADTTIKDALRLMIERDINALIVEDKKISELTIEMLLVQIKDIAKAKYSTVRDVMRKRVYTLDREENVESARKILLEAELIVVTENDKPIGVFTLRNYIVGLFKYAENVSKHTIGSLMTAPYVTIDPDIGIYDAITYMTEKEFKRYPVIVNNEIIGIVSMQDMCIELLRS